MLEKVKKNSVLFGIIILFSFLVLLTKSAILLEIGILFIGMYLTFKYCINVRIRQATKFDRQLLNVLVNVTFVLMFVTLILRQRFLIPLTLAYFPLLGIIAYLIKYKLYRNASRISLVFIILAIVDFMVLH